MTKCAKCGEPNKEKQLYYSICQDCATIIFECGCEAELELKGQDMGYWVISTLCEEHDPTWIEDKELEPATA